jgi:hypothetical protein
MRISISILLMFLLLSGCSSSGHKYYFSSVNGDDREMTDYRAISFRGHLAGQEALALKPGMQIILPGREGYGMIVCLLENINGLSGKEYRYLPLVKSRA